MELVIFIGAWFLAGVVNHVVGLGAAMVAMPMVVHFIPLSLAVPSSALIVLALNVQLAWSYRQSIQWVPLVYILIGSGLGTVAGIFLVKSVDEAQLKTLMGVFLICYAGYALFLEKEKSRRVLPLWGIPTGALSTFLGMAFSFNGPPLAVFATMAGWTADEVKGFLGASFIISGTTIVTGQLLAGLQTAQSLTFFASACPAALLGGLFGIRLARRFALRSTRRLLLCVLLFAGFSQIL